MREILGDKALRTWSASELASLGLVLFEQLFPRYRLVGDFRKLNQEVDDFLLENRRT